jgi:catechol 2,3-dioxygenase-like lactoylglutathione lyase family enzyme
MNIKSISGVVCFVGNLDKTAAFYEKLGFRFGKRTEDRLITYVNWFWVDFVTVGKDDEARFQKEAGLPNKGSGTFLCMSVDDVDVFYKSILSKGLIPSSEPSDRPTGRREFVLRDPDGYKLVFFQKK